MGLTSRRCRAAATVLAWTVALAAASAHAEEDVVRIRLPFVGDDAGFPEGHAPAVWWPERTTPGRTPELPRSDDAEHRPASLPRALPAFPDVTALLDRFADVRVERGVALFPADLAERAEVESLLRAVDARCARSLNVTLAVVHGSAAASADDVLRAPDPKWRASFKSRLGGLVVLDERTHSTWPASSSYGPQLVVPEPVTFALGPRAVVCVERGGGDGVVVSLQLHFSESTGRRTFDESLVRRVVPAVRFVAARVDVPLTPGRAELLTVGNWNIAVRVDGTLPDGPLARSVAEALPSRPTSVPSAPLVFPRSDASASALGWASSMTERAFPAEWSTGDDADDGAAPPTRSSTRTSTRARRRLRGTARTDRSRQTLDRPRRRHAPRSRRRGRRDQPGARGARGVGRLRVRRAARAGLRQRGVVRRRSRASRDTASDQHE